MCCTVSPASQLKLLYFGDTQVTDAGCAALAAALDCGALPALEAVYMNGIPVSAAAEAAVMEAVERTASRAR